MTERIAETVQFQWKTDNFKKSIRGNCLLLPQCSYAYGGADPASSKYAHDEIPDLT